MYEPTYGSLKTDKHAGTYAERNEAIFNALDQQTRQFFHHKRLTVMLTNMALSILNHGQNAVPERNLSPLGATIQLFF